MCRRGQYPASLITSHPSRHSSLYTDPQAPGPGTRARTRVSTVNPLLINKHVLSGSGNKSVAQGHGLWRWNPRVPLRERRSAFLLQHLVPLVDLPYKQKHRSGLSRMPLGEGTRDGARSTENFFRTMVVGHPRRSRKWVSPSTGRRRVEGPANNPFRISGINQCTKVNGDEVHPVALHWAISVLFPFRPNFWRLMRIFNRVGVPRKIKSAGKVPEGHSLGPWCEYHRQISKLRE